MRLLRSTLTGIEYPFERLEEFADNGESLEVVLPSVAQARVRPGTYLWERFADFLPFERMDPVLSLGEGNTPLLPAAPLLQQISGLPGLLLKDETQNPTWSFKDRGTLTTLFMAREMGERVTATISTGNMGHSVAAYAARAGIMAIVFIPHFAPEPKVQAMAIHGASVVRVSAPDYAAMKSAILSLAGEFRLRIVSGNGPIRVEGYKLIAFEMFEQLRGQVPDFIAVPTSACGHIRGLWKGWNELRLAGFVERVPRMIIVQAANNSPLVTAMRRGLRRPVPFRDFQTVAEAITSGNPQGGDEILEKAAAHGWLAGDATEEEILEAQRALAAAGHFVEPATAASLPVLKKLRQAGEIALDQTVVMMLTGSGLKDMGVLKHHRLPLVDTPLDGVRKALSDILMPPTQV